MKRTTILMLSLLTVGWQLSTAQAQVQLERKFAEGTSYKTSSDIQSIQSLKLNNMDLDSSAAQNIVIDVSIGERGPDGQLKIDYKIDSLRANMTVPNLGEIKFDSAKPDEATNSPLTPIFKATANSTWHTLLNKENEIVEVKGREDAFNSLDDSLKPFLSGQFDPEYLKDVARKEMARIPAKPVSPDDSWEQSEAFRLDGSQVMTFDKTYTYRGTEKYNGKELDRIDVKATAVKYEILPNSPLPLKVKNSDLKIGESTGKLYFDRELGRIVLEEQSHQVVGEFTLEVNGQELPSVLDLRLISNSRDE